MKNNLPFLEPRNELSLNATVVMAILIGLPKTRSGKLVLNLERLQIYLFLILNPTTLNKLLAKSNKTLIELREDEEYSVTSVSYNFDPLFGREKMQLILQFLSANGLLESTYSKDYGFVFNLNSKGLETYSEFSGEYFHDLSKYTEKASQLQSSSVGKLNSGLNQIIKDGG